MAPRRQSQQQSDEKDLQIPDEQQGTSRILGNIPGMSDMEFWLEMIRRVVREELDRDRFLRQTANQAERVGPIHLQLRFTNKMCSKYFTLSEISAEGNEPVQIEVFDVRSQSRVTDDPLISSLKVEICVVNGDFGSVSEDWTAEEFDANKLREREGRMPLLGGNRFLQLNEGVGIITGIRFTDNSSWVRSRRFRLAAKPLLTSSNQPNIREATTEPFTVKDNRGESYQKHERPSLSDNVWRLRKIAKGGVLHKKLSFKGIKTIKHMLRLYNTNPSSLQEIFGNIPRKAKEAIIEHAKAYRIDDEEYYVYQAPQQPISLLFNSIYKVVGVSLHGQNYGSPDALNSDVERQLVERVAQHAYNNLNDFIPVDGPLTFGPLSSPQAGLYSEPDQPLQQSVFPTAGQGQLAETWNQPSTSTTQLVDQVWTDISPAGFTELEMLPNSFPGGEFFSEYSQDIFLAASQFNAPSYVSTQSWGQDNGSRCVADRSRLYSNFAATSAVHVSSIGKFKGWLAALIWVISIRRCAARKRVRS